LGGVNEIFAPLVQVLFSAKTTAWDLVEQKVPAIRFPEAGTVQGASISGEIAR
jgi:hypothetical protein